MSKNIKFLVHGGVLAALYVVLTYAQNLLWPGSTTMAIQMRLSEALCIFAFFTPAAIPGLTLGCLLYNVSWAQALPWTGWWGVWPPFWPPPPCGGCGRYASPSVPFWAF